MFYLIASFLVSIFLIIQSAFADGYLFIAPQNLHLNDLQRIQQFNVVNKSSKKKTYRIKLKNYSMNEEGSLIEKDFPYSAKKAVRFAPRRITLEANEKQSVNVSASLGKLDNNQEYHVHAEFIEVENSHEDDQKVKQNIDSRNASFSASSAYGVAVPIFITKGDPKVTVSLKDFHIKKTEDNNIIAHITLDRQGDKTGFVEAHLVYTSTKGRKVNLSSPIKMKIYREIDQVTHHFTLPPPKGYQDFKDGTVTLTLFDLYEEKDLEHPMITQDYRL